MSTDPNTQSATAQPLGADELKRIDAWWRACNYLSVGMIYLRDNPLLKNPLAVEHGFQSLAWIGKEDKGTLDLVLDYASKGKHPDNTVAAQAIKACYQWRHLDGKTRKEFFEKICMYLEGLHSGMTGGDPKRRSSYETRYKAVENEGKDCLRELGDGTAFADPKAARAWFNDNKKGKWEDYTGPRFRKAAAPAEKEKDKEGGDAKPEG